MTWPASHNHGQLQVLNGRPWQKEKSAQSVQQTMAENADHGPIFQLYCITQIFTDHANPCICMNMNIIQEKKTKYEG